ncbi:uncharacterized protein LOC133315970 [Gastrolobium bilobum]|uniref:uncharacterized protein LOC133315970 n=1 Tax=Gastrolobium bilobum TaxID=150636 RepID=UPI002AB2A11C|nr:uncharacterized protein LOC133315970 [Gastrolobium bilobum]
MENKKKREVTVGDDGEVEDEIKMEKFYSLLRSFRDARDRRRRELKELETIESNKKKMKTTTASKPKSDTCFEWQDFTTEIHFRKPPLVFPNPVTVEDNNNKGKTKSEQQQQHDSLDLKLAL